MACKYCGKEFLEHGFLSSRCPRYSREHYIKLGYIDGQEYKDICCASTQHAIQPVNKECLCRI